jgi:glutamate 5-kinase
LNKHRPIWVIKVGSAVLVDGGPLLMRDWIRQVSQLRENFGLDIIWVSSGAIATARARTRRNWERLQEKQALSAIGQPLLMDSYNLALQSNGQMGAQVLLTYEDIRRKNHRENLKNTLSTLLKWGIVPILNENDAVATEEIQFGDNDMLSAMVARLMGADRLVLLTNVDGVYDGNPLENRDARLLENIPRLTPKHFHIASPGKKSEMGSGGMFSKLKAAHHAQAQGIETCILRGDTPQVLLKIARGEALGTRIGRNSENKKSRKKIKKRAKT